VKPFLHAVPLLLLVAGCTATTAGNGSSQTTMRTVGDFTQVQNNSSLAVTVTPGPTSVSVTADSNLLPYITTVSNGGVLVIDQTQSFRSSLPLRVAVTTPALTAISDEGAGSLGASGFTANDFTIDLSGAGAMNFQGTVAALNLGLSGAGSMKLIGNATGLQATLDGAGSVDGTRFPIRGAAHTLLRGAGGASLVIQGDSSLEVDGAGSLNVALDGGTTNFTVNGPGNIIWSGQTTVGQQIVTGPGSVQHR
jgi:hypothetical protein